MRTDCCSVQSEMLNVLDRTQDGNAQRPQSTLEDGLRILARIIARDVAQISAEIQERPEALLSLDGLPANLTE